MADITMYPVVTKHNIGEISLFRTQDFKITEIRGSILQFKMEFANAIALIRL
jgi:hypothetical protein